MVHEERESSEIRKPTAHKWSSLCMLQVKSEYQIFFARLFEDDSLLIATTIAKIREDTIPLLPC